MSRLRFSVIIVSLNGAKRLPACLNALSESLDAFANATETLVVDNGSNDGTSQVIKDGFPWVKLLCAERNLGFAGGNNLGIDAAEGEIVILLNDDTYPQAGWLDVLDATARQLTNWAALGCLLLYPETRDVQHAGGIIEPNALSKHIGWGDPESEWAHREPFEADYVSGAAMAISREALDAIGTLDAKFFPIYFEETDFCVRAREAGWGIWMVPQAIVLHDESQVTQVRSAGFYAKYQTNRIRFVLKTKSLRNLLRWARAEFRWLKGHHPWDQAIPLIKAWASNTIRLPATLAARRRHFQVVKTGRPK
jgi:GT2 family glycosyltransferase